MRVVLDTGIYISALITKGTPPDRLYQSWDEGAFHLVTSSEQIAELSRVVDYKKLRKFITLDEAYVLIDNLYNHAEIVSNLPDVHLSPDPDDDLILATAIAGRVDYIISGDKRDMLSLKVTNNNSNHIHHLVTSGICSPLKRCRVFQLLRHGRR